MRGTIFYIIVFSICSILPATAQDDTYKETGTVVYGKVENGDTLFYSSIDEVVIMPKPVFNSKREYKKYSRLVRNVKKVYPFAKVAGQEYKKVEQELLELETERQRKEYLKQVEKDLIAKYEDDLSKLTITQGRILIKLIDREIGETSYDLLKEFRGSFSAIFWQALARIFGHNLKTHFDPQGEDKELNQILILIDNGLL